MSKQIYKAKRIIDFVVAMNLLIITLPFLLATIILLAFANKGRVFFIQKRPGRYGRIFKIVKFKTMNDRRDSQGNLLPDDVRLTAIGRMVRRLSLDEIPQLLNVIKGDMSLVGPRPLLPEYLSLYNTNQQRRHNVKPGITGWAQVNGRNAISWQKKFELDVWYVDNISFRLDLQILFATFENVLKSKDISAEGVETMTKFTGNN